MKKHGSIKAGGGDKKTRDKMKSRNPRKDKKGGRTSKQCYKNYEPRCYFCKVNPCKCK